MKTKLKIIIPAAIAVIAVIIAVVCISFTPSETVDITSLVSTAQKYLVEQNYEQAIAEFEKAIQIDPMNVEAYIGIAQAYEGVGDTDKAVEWLEKGYELTGDAQLKELLDELLSSASVPSETTTETAAETSAETPKTLEKRVDYADGWYSIFQYNENEDIIGMALYNKKDEQRMHADYIYDGDAVKRLVYVDENLYEERNVIFRDIMADAEKEKRERANTTKQFDNFWFVYDENGVCIESRWRNLVDSEGNPLDDAGGEYYYTNGIVSKRHIYHNFSGSNWDEITYFDEKGYELTMEVTHTIEGVSEAADGTSTNTYTYTYDYDENGYPIVQYKNGEKQNEYINFYKNGKFEYAIWHLKNEKNNNHGVTSSNSDGADSNLQLDKNGLYTRSMYHNYYEYTNNRVNNSYQTGVVYYIPSFDGTTIVDGIDIKDHVLFECPYCS